MTVSLPNFPIHIMSRKKCIEVYLRNVSKATAIRRILQHHQNRVHRASVADTDFPSSTNTQEAFALQNFEPPAVTDFCDFILCIGDDRADEYMFQYLRKLSQRKSSICETKLNTRMMLDQVSELSMDPSLPDYPYALRRNSLSQDPLSIFTCTVGSKSSAAKWYLPSPTEVLSILSSL
jgi:trehalose-phosphatase